MTNAKAGDERADIDHAVEGKTIASEFATTVGTYGDRVALRWRAGDGTWQQWTWREYGELAARAAAGLRALGVGRGDRVALMMRNIPEFHVVDTAAMLVGATPFSVYNSSSPEQVRYLASHAGAKVAIVEDDAFLERVLAVRSDIPTLGPVVTVSGSASAEGVSAWDDLLGSDPVDLAEASTTASPDDLATLIYTSGTTGPPKGVMISQYNVVWTAESLLRSFGAAREELVGFKVVSYLPMAHIAERMTSHYAGIMSAYEVTTCPETRDLATYLVEVRPNIAFGVPRVWEKVQSGVEAALAGDAEKKQKFDDAVAAAIPLVEKRTLQGDRALTDEERGTLDFLDQVAFAQVRELVGLDQARFAISGAAPISVELVQWYRGIGVPFSEIYGMSEDSGPLTWDPIRVKPGACGRPLPGVEVRLADDGEVLGRGGNIFVGYLNDPEKTAETLDADGWLHTGDIGEIDGEGYLRIVDRKKELIITAGGKNISPANIEAALKGASPLIGQVAVIGDKRPFITALIVLDHEVVTGWATAHGIEFSDVSELADDPRVMAEIERCVGEVNARFNQVEQVKRFKVLAEEWAPDSAELTPTMKLKRRGINAKYAGEIEELYRR
ncbi:MAG TPA: AMP-binding protein [Acidimicrobiales bacterium]|nr:AMP-binding protein [Acidimicrobiales bacterium]